MRVYGLLQLAVQLTRTRIVRLDERLVYVLGSNERLPLLPAKKENFRVKYAMKGKKNPIFNRKKRGKT